MEPLPLYAVAEYSYCPRSSWYVLTDTPKMNDENAFIQSGRFAHQKVDEGYIQSKGAKKVHASFRLFSEKLNIIGKADIVEFYEDGSIMPVEFKRGRTRENKMHQIQLALMTLCLKEMFPAAKIEQAAIFFTEDRQKLLIPLANELLQEAENIGKSLLLKVKKGLIPADFPMQKDSRCHGCCFYDLCYL